MLFTHGIILIFGYIYECLLIRRLKRCVLCLDNFKLRCKQRRKCFLRYLYLTNALHQPTRTTLPFKMHALIFSLSDMLPHWLRSAQIVHLSCCSILLPDQFNADLHFSCRLTFPHPVFQKWAWEGLVWENTALTQLSFLWATLGYPGCIPGAP